MDTDVDYTSNDAGSMKSYILPTVFFCFLSSLIYYFKL